MSTVERPLRGAEIEVTAKATRRRFTLDYKREIHYMAAPGAAAEPWRPSRCSVSPC